MTYYFTLSNENVKNFYSSNWVVFEEARVFGGGVIIKTPNDINKLFRCSLLRSSDTSTLFEIDLSKDDIYETVFSAAGYITLVKLTNDKTGEDWTCTLLHGTTDFFDLAPNEYLLKGMLPITKPGWSRDSKPLSMKTIVNSEMDFIPPYLEDMRKMNMFESDKRVRIPKIKKVIFNYPVTVVLWTDGTKTIVRYDPNKEKIGFDKEKAVAMCFVKKIYKDAFKSHWLDSISKAIAEAPFNSPDIDVLERMAAKRVAEEKDKIKAKVNELDEEIKNNPPKPLEEMPEKKESPNPGKKNKMDKDILLACIKEDLTIDEIAEMNSWDKRNVARMYYKLTGKRPEAKPNTYSELDTLFENGVSVDAAARRTGFSKNIVAMRYAKLQNRANKE